MDPAEPVQPPTGPRLALLKELGFGELTHDSHVPFLSHLLGTRRVLVDWGERPALCDAGLFHSAYGTEYFAVAHPASRDAVRDVIGAEAEAIAWAWCTIERDSIELGDGGPGDAGTVVDRRTGDREPMAASMVADIATLWAADTVEQIGRLSDDERGFADGLGRVLHRASPAARQAATAFVTERRSTWPSGGGR
jgi:hypothetical protein